MLGSADSLLWSLSLCTHLKRVSLFGLAGASCSGLNALLDRCANLSVLHLVRIKGLDDSAFNEVYKPVSPIKELKVDGCSLGDEGLSNLVHFFSATLIHFIYII